ncbi:MAG: FAD-binding oxidoreductase [Roseiflexus sp.]|nr:FAD-binding oxidoreductase [Roseiflexus sp.]MDW8146750.1 FAD-dependent oxidoreductase [Roseiflexaceae bacterium]MDW8232975.1 FAD-dependent oxidoreductase [Roseiflexaceae bacterium]
MAPTQRSLTSRILESAAALTARTWPLAAQLLPERLEFDDTPSIWHAGTPDYQPRPPLRGVISADLAIIGGGFTGVSTAYHVTRRFPQRRIVLLEATSLANGASGRNGGLALNWINGVDTDDPELTRKIYTLTSAGLIAIRTLIERHRLPVDHRFDGTLTLHTSPERAEAAHAEAEYLQELGIPVRFLPPSDLRSQFDACGIYGATLEPGTGQINGAQFVRGLRPVLEECGVAIYEQTPVLRIQIGRIIRLTTPHGEVYAPAVVLATNGYTSKLGLFRDALFPLHSSVFATAPLTPEQQQNLGWRAFAGFADDCDRIAYGSLTCTGHLVFGGGSNQAYVYLFNNGTRLPPESAVARRSQAAIVRTLARYFPSATMLPIAYRWSGVLDITLNRQPLWGRWGEYRNVYYALGYSGHGITLANLAGEFIADLYGGDDSRWRWLPFYQSRYPPIPPEPFRWLGYQAFTRLTGRSPRV